MVVPCNRILFYYKIPKQHLSYWCSNMVRLSAAGPLRGDKEAIRSFDVIKGTLPIFLAKHRLMCMYVQVHDNGGYE